MELKQSAVREKTTTESRGGDQSSVTKKYLFIKNIEKTSVAGTLEVMTGAPTPIVLTFLY
jgi:hypothetical protein